MRGGIQSPVEGHSCRIACVLCIGRPIPSSSPRQHFEGPASEAGGYLRKCGRPADRIGPHRAEDDRAATGRDAASPVEAPSDARTTTCRPMHAPRTAPSRLKNRTAQRAVGGPLRQTIQAPSSPARGKRRPAIRVRRVDFVGCNRPVRPRLAALQLRTRPCRTRRPARRDYKRISGRRARALTFQRSPAATNASAWPFSSVALILTEFDSFPGVFFIGTGVAIGPNTNHHRLAQCLAVKHVRRSRPCLRIHGVQRRLPAARKQRANNQRQRVES